jgi:DNA-directed RNA polymerase subunit beta'
MFYKDSERVKSVEGVELLRTQLVLEIEHAQASEHTGAPIIADIELVQDMDNPEIQRLQLVILESLVLRRDIAADATQGSTDTRLLVEDGQEIPPGAVIARTEIQCKDPGEIRGIREGSEAIRRVLVLRNSDSFTLSTSERPKIKVGSLLIAGTEITPGVFTAESGQVLSVEQAAGSKVLGVKEGDVETQSPSAANTQNLAANTYTVLCELPVPIVYHRALFCRWTMETWCSAAIT